MGAYDLISTIEPSKLDILISRGFLRQTVWRDIERYEFYMNECLKGIGRMQARTNTAEKFNISEDRVSQIIQKMK